MELKGFISDEANQEVGAQADTTECFIRLGKGKKVILWNENLLSVVGALYGSTATFLQTNPGNFPPPLPS